MRASRVVTIWCERKDRKFPLISLDHIGSAGYTICSARSSSLADGVTVAKSKEAGGKITQKEAVKQAIAAGKDSPPDGVAFVKEQFGITLNNGAFSTLKSQLKNASGATPSRRGRKPGRVASKPAGHVGNGKATPADLARAVKGLIATYGAVAVSDMVAVFTD